MRRTTGIWLGALCLGLAIILPGTEAPAGPPALGTPMRTFEGHGGAVNAVAFSPDGTRVLTASSDNTARLWDAESGQEIHTFIGHTDSVTSAAFSPDGTQAVTASRDGTIRLWDAGTGNLIRQFEEDLGPDWPPNLWNWSFWAVDFSPDGTQVVSAEGSIAAARTGVLRLWDAASGEQVRTIADGRDSFTSARFTPDGEGVVAGWLYATGENVTTYVPLAEYGWDLRNLHGELQNQGVEEIPFGPQIVFADYSPVTSTVLLGGYAAHRVGFWEPGEAEHFVSLALPMPRAGVFSPAGSTALTGHVDARARLLDSQTGEVLLLLEGHGGFVNGVAFSPDGTLALTASDDARARLWELPPPPLSIPAQARANGDLNNDGVVDFADLTLLLEYWGVEVDGVPIGFADMLAVLENWGADFGGPAD